MSKRSFGVIQTGLRVSYERSTHTIFSKLWPVLTFLRMLEPSLCLVMSVIYQHIWRNCGYLWPFWFIFILSLPAFALVNGFRLVYSQCDHTAQLLASIFLTHLNGKHIIMFVLARFWFLLIHVQLNIWHIILFVIKSILFKMFGTWFIMFWKFFVFFKD